MLKELFDAVVDMGREAARAKATHIPGEPAHVYHLLHPGGRVDVCCADPAPRAHRVGDLDSLVRMARGFADDDCHVSVWYSREGAVAVLNDSERRDRVSLPLALHRQLLGLSNLEANPHPFDQRAFVTYLRVQLHDCLGRAPGLVDVVRRLKFRQLAQGESKVEHGKSSIGRSLEAELTGAGTIPQEVVLDVPVFGNLPIHPFSFPVPCALDVDPGAEKFYLQPYPGATEAAMRGAELEIGRILTESLKDQDHVTVYYGQP